MEPTANATQNSTSATQSAGDQLTSSNSGATESVDSSRESVETAKLDYQNAITSGHEVNISQKKSAYADALDAHIKVLENKDSQLQTELDTAARNRNIPQIDSVATRIRANDLELTQTREARSAISTTPEPVPNPGPVQLPIDGQLGAANLGSVLPKFSNVIDGTHGTSADAALGILENVSAGRPAFNPELGTKGPVQWFVTEGNPRTGGGTADVTLPVDFDVPRGADVLEFNDAQLKEIYAKHLPEATELATKQFAENHPNANLNSNGSIRKIEFNARNIAELEMWTEVGNRVAATEDGIGRVVQTANSPFSQGRPGHFMLTSNPEVARVKGGAGALLDIINAKGIRAEPAVVEAAEQAAKNGTINGRVQGVFRVAGRVLVVAGAAADGYRIYQADDKIREGVIVGGGWAGAGTAIGAYNLATGPTNAAGPVAWGVNALGNIGAGFAGYFAGEKIAEYVYDLAIDPNPLEVPAG